MNKILLTTLVAVLSTVFTNSALSQVPGIEWQKSYGGGTTEDGFTIIQTFDGGYMIVGRSNSFDGDVTGNHGNFDVWLVKTSSSGAIEWQKSIGGSGLDHAFSVVQTPDSGYTVGGSTSSNDGDVTGNHGLNDCWVVKLSPSGVIQWQKCYGGSGNDIGISLQHTTDGGYVVGGYSSSLNGDVTGNHGANDYWVVKIDATGTLQWQKSYGGTANDYSNKIQQTADGGYVVTGVSNSSDGDVTNHHGSADIWVVKISTLGVIQWQKSLGGTLTEGGPDVIQTTTGDYVVAGYTSSSDGDVTSIHGASDNWVVRLSSLGTIVWQKTMGGTGTERAFSLLQSADGGFMVAGYSDSHDGDVTENKGNLDYWLVKLTTSGTIEWQKSLGGTDGDAANCIKQTADGGYILVGHSLSGDGDATLNHGDYDYWVVKLKSLVAVPQLSHTSEITISPNPTTNTLTISGAENATIQVYNTFGQLVKEAQNASEISLAEFPAAMYFIRVFNDQGEMIHSEKIVKQ